MPSTYHFHIIRVWLKDVIVKVVVVVVVVVVINDDDPLKGQARTA